MPRFIGDNGLSLALLSLFLLALAGQAVTGWKSYNQEQQHHNQPQAGFGEYLTEGHFIEAVFENWESEFLQDAVYVLFTAFLFQRGSAESKDPDKDESGRQRSTRVIERSQCALAGSARRRLAEPLQTLAADHLSAALSFFIRHAAIGGAEEYSSDQLAHGGQAVSALQYLFTNQFWFESLQNWQSEFLALFSMVVLSIFLRQQDSPESKPVASPHSETGSA